MTAWGEIIGAALSGSGLTALLTHLRQSRKDKSDVKAAAIQSSDALTMQMWVEITKEQRDWRETMRREIDRLQKRGDDLQAENAQLLRRVAALEGRNTDLQRENEELELRVKELERDLKQHAAEKVS